MPLAKTFCTLRSKLHADGLRRDAITASAACIDGFAWVPFFARVRSNSRSVAATAREGATGSLTWPVLRRALLYGVQVPLHRSRFLRTGHACLRRGLSPVRQVLRNIDSHAASPSVELFCAGGSEKSTNACSAFLPRFLFPVSGTSD